MSAIGKWFLQILLGWLLKFLREFGENYLKRKAKIEEREKKSAEADKKLEEAKSEQEIIDRGGDVLRRD